MGLLRFELRSSGPKPERMAKLPHSPIFYYIGTLKEIRLIYKSFYELDMIFSKLFFYFKDNSS